MKIFGFEIKRSKHLPKVKDEIPEVKAVVPDTINPASILKVQDPTLKYVGSKFVGRGAFYSLEYDLSEIGRIEDTESFCRQAFDKKTALMFKEGWTLVGKNKRVINYVKARFAQITQASDTPIEQLFRQIGSALIKKSNCFIVKVRKTKASGGKVRIEVGSKKKLEPVAAYFIVPAETMEYQLSGNKVIKWRQNMPNGYYKEYDPENIIHIYYGRKEGFVVGTPTIIPVIDDIRALRKIEENIELLIYQHLFPLFQYKVGTETAPAGLTETGAREIDVVRTEIQYMPTEGGIVTPERHEIKAIGAEGRAIRAEGYLEHFKRRVIAGLGISEVDLGQGDTANRSTSDNMSRNLIDSVKDFQQTLEIFINKHIINELLLESTFGSEILNEENRCYLRFKEIDIDMQIKKEAHVADQFNKDMITLTEARSRVGFEPILIPSAEDVENGTDNQEQYPDWNTLRWKLFTLPTLIIQARDEPWSPISKAAVLSASLPMTAADTEESIEQEKEFKKDTEPKAPSTIPKSKSALPKQQKKQQDSYLNEAFLQTKIDLINRITSGNTFDIEWTSTLIRTQLSTGIEKLIVDQMIAFTNGYSIKGSVGSMLYMQQAQLARTLFRNRAEKYITKLINDIIGALRRNYHQLESQSDLVNTIRATFDVLTYRTKFIEDVEIRKANSYGKALSVIGVYEGLKSVPSNQDICSDCHAKTKEVILLDNLVLDFLPPYHASCQCGIEPITIVTDFKDGKIDDPSEYVSSSEFKTCPRCGKTAIRTKNTNNIYNCKACGHSFQVTEDEDDQNGEQK